MNLSDLPSDLSTPPGPRFFMERQAIISDRHGSGRKCSWRSMKNLLLASLAPWRAWRYFRYIQCQISIFHSLYLNIPVFIK
ncbi:hypothetical protein RCIA152 [Methanocella arvoryzae MRE50]|uniref:Uncharacterized protein n=1 Tax=Methanocella arvoryzae (strain DSM 22066 / NBRC 105507 / MRE50) TaxID=351160 RepID=Q0W375_METAR|nr:hypothetical protein RCIA152 [Methanocella arvoryzae MRE50]